MKRRILIALLISAIGLSLSSCLSLPQNSSSDEMATEETAAADSAPEGDDFAELENNQSSDATTQTAENTTVESTQKDEFDLESQPEQQPQEQAPPAQEMAQNQEQKGEFDDLNLEETLPPETTENKPQEQAPPVQETPIVTQEEPQVPQTPTEPTPEVPVAAKPVEIKSVQFKANDAGGTLVIQASGPMQYTTRKNPDSNQIIVEVANAHLPDRLKRPLNMKDISGSIGAVDSYQTKNSKMARFVIQLRPNASTPFVTAEGDTLLVVSDQAQMASNSSNTKDGQQKNSDASGSQSSNGGSEDEATEKILTSRNLQEFLAGNTKFYGKKISLETNNMPIREALRYISDNAGVNMIIAENVAGNVSLKLREVPWDQAFVVIMKTKDLGYVRQGNVLRVATLADLKKEEKDVYDLTMARLDTEPLKVNVYAVNYAKVDDLATRVKDFLTTRGKVTSDPRTNSVVVTDIPQNLEKISQLIQSLDIQPPQVLIEGRVVEATDSFQRQVGINWGFSGNDVALSSTINLRPSLNISTGADAASKLSLQVGTLDVLGDLNAVISMNELENKIRVLSSPRIVTLSNEKATINQKISIPIPSVQVVNNTAINTFTFKDLELKLDVTPQITSNASVIMAINVKRELQGASINDQVSIESREASTKVMVQNGQTSIIGGVYQNDSNESVTGIPWLKDIPILGSLFRAKKTDNRRTELMIFLTPRIVAAGSEATIDMTKRLGQTEGGANAKQ